jgi:hypothetical protein
MTTFKFSEEARLYSQEYAIVKEVEKAWRNDLERFHNSLFARVANEIDDLRSSGKPKSDYRYWFRKSWEGNPGPLYLWQQVCYPELLRDKVVEFSAYYSDDKNLWDSIHRELQTEAQAVLGNSKIAGLRIELGRINSWRPLTLRVPWEEDPLEESVPVIVRAIGALDGIVRTLHSLTKVAPG